MMRGTWHIRLNKRVLAERAEIEIGDEKKPRRKLLFEMRERATPLNRRTIAQLTQRAEDVMVIGADRVMRRGLLQKPRPLMTYRGHRRNLGRQRYRSQKSG